ncbi:hypothetical protein BCU84_01570 [Shewanella sp. 10N.286.51.B7]|uniref:DUF2956 domain-containing protein n=1 Tax=Shewanella sp. 10N.286.51.B7 TaxID=1880836 RepID=UPI000C819051|nr:DUF2956 domain-containing protein [Shewanella sp. 10N.286.51.B7]PMG75992.1 hypothetical protein BCU84_01570 [Shewanella sp. 10N.286.51.B7]
MAKSISQETQNEAMKVAKATQKPSQTKEQTKLIALGIEKGIAEYKKQQKAKARGRDKLRKQSLKLKSQQENTEQEENTIAHPSNAKLPWILLVASWVGFLSYALLNGQ